MGESWRQCLERKFYELLHSPEVDIQIASEWMQSGQDEGKKQCLLWGFWEQSRHWSKWMSPPPTHPWLQHGSQQIMEWMKTGQCCAAGHNPPPATRWLQGQKDMVFLLPLSLSRWENSNSSSLLIYKMGPLDPPYQVLVRIKWCNATEEPSTQYQAWHIVSIQEPKVSASSPRIAPALPISLSPWGMIKGQKPGNYKRSCAAVLAIFVMSSAVLSVRGRSSTHVPSCLEMVFVSSWKARPKWRHFEVSKLSVLKLQL